jgi:hypothetical protein
MKHSGFIAVDAGRWAAALALISLTLLSAACGPGDVDHQAEDSRTGEHAFELLLSIPESAGSDETPFYRIGLEAVRFDPDEPLIHVADQFGPSVRTFDLEANLLQEFGGVEGRDEFSVPFALTVTSNRVDLVDGSTNRVLRFDRSGTLVERFESGVFEQDGRERPYWISAPLRHGLRFVTWGEGGERGGALIRSDETFVEEAHRYVWRNVIFLASRPGVAVGSRSGIPSPGPGGSYGIAGDSLYIYADTHHGRVRWALVEEHGLRTVREADLGLEPVRYDIDMDEARQAEADAWGVPVSDLELHTPQYAAILGGRMVVAENGDAWLQRRSWTGARPERFQEERILVPFDPDDPVLEVALPENSLLSDVSGDRLLGIHMDPTTGEEFVHLYRFIPGVE